MEVVVYIDWLFAYQLFLDSVLLFLAVLLAKTRYTLPRFLLSSIALALYGTVSVFFAPAFLFSLGAGTVAAFLVSLLLGGRAMWRKTFLALLAVTLLLGGMLFAILGERNLTALLFFPFLGEIGGAVLCGGILAVWGLVWGFSRLCVRNFSREKLLLPLEIEAEGIRKKVTVLADTGCELTMPLSGEPMMVISQRAWGKKLPSHRSAMTTESVAGACTIQVFFPDRVKVLRGDTELSGMVGVGIADACFSKDGLYDGVLNPEMLKIGGKTDGNQTQMAYDAPESCPKAGSYQTQKGALYRGK